MSPFPLWAFIYIYIFILFYIYLYIYYIFVYIFIIYLYLYILYIFIYSINPLTMDHLKLILPEICCYCVSQRRLGLICRGQSVTIPPYIFPSIMCFRRQFLRKMWPIQLAFLHFFNCSTFLSFLTLCNLPYFSHDRYRIKFFQIVSS
jgi:hypothetical protein